MEDPTWAEAVDEVHGHAAARARSPWDALTVVPRVRGEGPRTIAPEDVDLGTPLWAAPGARRLRLPIVLSDDSQGQLSPQARLAMLQAAARTGCALRLPDPSPDIVELAAELGVAFWSVVGPRRSAHTVEAARVAAVLELELLDMGRGWELLRPYDAFDQSGSLANMVTALRQLGSGVPVLVDVGPAVDQTTLAAAISSGAAGVLVRARSRASALQRSVSGPSPLAAVAATRRAVSRAKRPEGAPPPVIAVGGGFKDGVELAKVLSLGADMVVMATAPRIALGCGLCGTCGPGECSPGAAPDGWRAMSDRLVAYIERVSREAAGALAQMGCASAGEASLESLEARDYETAATTGAALAGYGEPLPMWLH